MKLRHSARSPATSCSFWSAAAPADDGNATAAALPDFPHSGDECAETRPSATNPESVRRRGGQSFVVTARGGESQLHDRSILHGPTAQASFQTNCYNHWSQSRQLPYWRTAYKTLVLRLSTDATVVARGSLRHQCYTT